MTAGTESTALNGSATVILVAEVPPVWDPRPSSATNVSTTHTRTSTDAALATATGTEMTVASIWEYVTDLAHGATAQDPMTMLPVTDTHNFRLPTTLVYATHGTAESNVLALSENATTSATSTLEQQTKTASSAK
jgi:hypothetical protein